MDDNSKILNPICIRLDNYFDILLKNIEGYSSCSLMPGIMVGGEHYGFVVISSKDGKQKETVYPTSNKISSIGVEDNKLQIFEDKKKVSWLFDLNGKLIRKAERDFFISFNDVCLSFWIEKITVEMLFSLTYLYPSA